MAETVLSISLKEYKKQIDDLRATLLGLDDASEEYLQTVNEIRKRQNKLNEALNAGKKYTDAQEGSYNALVAQMSKLKKAWRETNDEAKRNELGKQIDDINKELKKMDSSIGNFQRNVGNYTSAVEGCTDGTISLKAELRNIITEMANLASAGQYGSDAYIELAKRAGEYRDRLSDASNAVNRFASDTKAIDNVIDIAKSSTAVFGLMKGTMSALGVETEDATKAIEKLQGVMSVLTSLQTIQASLMDKSSATYRLYNSVLNAFGLSANSAVVATNSLSSAINASNGMANASLAVTQANTVAQSANAVATAQNTMAREADTVATKIQNAEVGTALYLSEEEVGLILEKAHGYAILKVVRDNDVKVQMRQIDSTKKLNIIEKAHLSLLMLKHKIMEGYKELQFQGLGAQIKLNKAIKEGTIVDKIYIATATVLYGTKQKLASLTKSLSTLFTAEGMSALGASIKNGLLAASNTALALTFGLATAGAKLLKGALNALGIGLIITAIVALVDAVVLIGKKFGIWQGIASALSKTFDFLVNAVKSAHKGIKSLVGIEEKEIEVNKKLIKTLEEELETRRKINDAVREEQSQYNQLKNQWESLSTLKERQEFVKDYADELSKLGFEINNVADAERLFATDGALAFAQGLRLRAELTLLQQKLLKNMMEQEKLVEGNGAWGGEKALRLKDEEQEILNTITLTTKRLNELKKDYSSIKNEPKGNKSNKTDDEFINSVLHDLERREKEISAYYDMIKAKGKSTIEDEIAEEKLLNEARNEAYKKIIDHLDKEKEKRKANSEERKKIEKDFISYKDKLSDENTDYEIKKTELLTKKEKEEQEKRLKNIKEYQTKAKKEVDNISKNSPKNGSEKSFENTAGEFDFKKQKQEIQEWSDYNKQVLIDNFNNITSTFEKQKQVYDETLRNMKEELAEINPMSEQYKSAKEAYDAMLADYNNFINTYLQATEEFNKKLENLQSKTTVMFVKVETEKRKSMEQTVVDTLNAYGDLSGAIADFYEAEINLKVKKGKMSEDEAKKEFERIKKFQIAETVINTLAGAIGAFMQDKKAYPAPYNYIIASADMAATLASGWAQIRQIQATEYGSASGGASGSNGIISASVNPVLDEELDSRSLQTLQTDNTAQDMRVYVVESDISNSQNKVQVRENASTF